MNQTLSVESKFKFINNRISKGLDVNSDARVSLNAIFGFMPADGRYDLYKEVAEETLGKKWQCASMPVLLQEF